MNWSHYQLAIFAAVAAILQSGRDLVVLARAGTGKTTTILEAVVRFCRAEPHAQVLLCAFNARIAKELESRLATAGLTWQQAEARTLHSVGLAAIRRAWGKTVRVEPAKGRDIAKRLAAEYDARAKREELPRIQQLATKVAKLADLAKGLLIDPDYQPGLAAVATRFRVADQSEVPVVSTLAGAAMHAAAEDQSQVDFGDQIWLPYYCDLQPWPRSLVVVDEAQDMNPAQLWLARASVKRGGRLVAVGDDRQCQPAGTMVLTPDGEVPIEQLCDGDAVTAWDRHSQALVGCTQALYKATVAKRLYEGILRKITVGAKSTECTLEHVWTVKTTRRLDLWAVYLMRKGDNYRVGWCQLFDKAGSLHLGQRTRLEDADAAWILSLHDSKRDASLTESLTSNRYSIPLVQFKQSVASPTARLLDQTYLDEFWLRVGDTAGGAYRCLTDHGRLIQHPFYINPRGRRYSRTTVMEVVAANLFSAFMQVPVVTDEKNVAWRGFNLSQRHYNGLVYSLNVPKHHHYVADGIVTHNCIYGWRGADTGFLNRMVTELNAATLPLPVTYRCPQSVVREAQQIVPDYQAGPNNPEGVVRRAVLDLSKVAVGDFILSRTNAPLLGLALSLLADGVPAAIQGRDIMQGLLRLAARSKADTTAELLRWLAVYEPAEVLKLRTADADESVIDQLHDQCACLRALAPDHTLVRDLTAALQALFADGDDTSRVTLSTVHRAKGLERDRVWLLAATLREGGEEDNIRYVAITRARHELIYCV